MEANRLERLHRSPWDAGYLATHNQDSHLQECDSCLQYVQDVQMEGLLLAAPCCQPTFCNSDVKSEPSKIWILEMFSLSKLCYNVSEDNKTLVCSIQVISSRNNMRAGVNMNIHQHLMPFWSPNASVFLVLLSNQGQMVRSSKCRSTAICCIICTLLHLTCKAGGSFIHPTDNAVTFQMAWCVWTNKTLITSKSPLRKSLNK